MKKILTSMIACACLVGFSACDSFLDEEPKSSMTGVMYYQTADQIIANVNSMYRTGAPSYMSNMGGAYRPSETAGMEILTGYFRNDFDTQEKAFYHAYALDRQENTAMTCSNYTNGIWQYCYQVISRANGVLKYIDNISMNDKEQYKAEARFFRALNFFYLVKVFGDVPMITDFVESMDTEMQVERTAESDIFNQVIIPDLEYCVSNLPAKSFSANGHRVTKYVASMVLADVYMRLGNYTAATPILKDVVTNSGAKLTENVDLAENSAYNILRVEEDLDEVSWAYEYDGAISNNGNFPTKAFNGDAEQIFDNSYTLWVNTFNVSPRFLNVYEATDLRVQPNQFFHWAYTNPKNGKSWSSKTPCNWYWFQEDAVLETKIGTKDWNFYRYAEVLLSAAESIAQSDGVTEEAKKYLAQVQARANMEGKTVAEIAAALPTDKNAFIEACWTERLRELPLDMKLWDLCVRTGKFPNISETTKGQVTYETLIGAKNGSGATFQATDLYWPIPIDEIQRNPELTQNDGYATK